MTAFCSNGSASVPICKVPPFTSRYTACRCRSFLSKINVPCTRTKKNRGGLASRRIICNSSNSRSISLNNQSQSFSCEKVHPWQIMRLILLCAACKQLSKLKGRSKRVCMQLKTKGIFMLPVGSHTCPSGMTMLSVHSLSSCHDPHPVGGALPPHVVLADQTSVCVHKDGLNQLNYTSFDPCPKIWRVRRYQGLVFDTICRRLIMSAASAPCGISQRESQLRLTNVPKRYSCLRQVAARSINCHCYSLVATIFNP